MKNVIAIIGLITAIICFITAIVNYSGNAGGSVNISNSNTNINEIK